MILRNKKGNEKEFKILMKYFKEDEEFIIYEDSKTKKVYGGKIENNHLKSLSEEEYELLNDKIDRLVGEK